MECVLISISGEGRYYDRSGVPPMQLHSLFSLLLIVGVYVLLLYFTYVGRLKGRSRDIFGTSTENLGKCCE